MGKLNVEIKLACLTDLNSLKDILFGGSGFPLTLANGLDKVDPVGCATRERVKFDAVDKGDGRA